MAKGKAYGFSGNFFDFFSLTSVGATAETIATGIDGGDGNDTLVNITDAVLTVKATSYAEAEGAGTPRLAAPLLLQVRQQKPQQQGSAAVKGTM